jgi:PhzF family phenazine biosynthesis protein
MSLPVYYVDAFTNKLFSGNPAAVIFSDLDDSDLMQKIAAENNLSETAFIREVDNNYLIRWFAPSCEIDLCGHATIASAFVFFNFIDKDAKSFLVNSKVHGPLEVKKENDSYILNFPADQLKTFNNLSQVEAAIGIHPVEIYEGRDDLLVILSSEEFVQNLSPDFSLIKSINKRGLIVSAQGKEYDFVSRCFYPATGVNEDPVTGSAHTSLTPYWSQKLAKTKLKAKQLSERGGLLTCELKDSRVLIGGNASLYMKGEIIL